MKTVELQWYKEVGTMCVSLLLLKKAVKLLIMSNG